MADVDKKRRFVKDVTNAAAVLYGLPAKDIVVLLQGNTSDNIAVGGQLLIDRRDADKPSP